jgi:hypothetical protein
VAGATAHPPAPWQLVGQLWLSLFHLRDGVDALRPAGLYGAAFVSYEPGGSLSYAELLVARPVRAERPGRSVSITDIWVDSPESRDGGRALWAIPKDLCDFTWESTRSGPLARTEWSASTGSRPIASARFTDVSRAAPRTPFRFSTWQPPLAPGGSERTAPVRGSAQALACRGAWDFDPEGPLAWLRPARRLASGRMASFRLSFG